MSLLETAFSALSSAHQLTRAHGAQDPYQALDLLGLIADKVSLMRSTLYPFTTAPEGNPFSI